MAKKQEYGNESITSLKGADRVRKRPAVIFGSDGVEGCAHSIFEIVSNSIDEARDGHGDTINVTRCKDGSVIVEDFGRGMPVDWNNGEGRYNWELLFCEMYAGGKYGEGEDNYEFSLGLNGLGLCATQYASAWMTADIYRDGYHYHLDFKKGENVGGLQKEAYKGRRTGSIIHWKPDDEVFTDIDVPGSYYKDTLRRQAVVNAGLTLKTEYAYSDQAEGYVFDQTPEANAEVRRGGTVTAMISEGTGLLLVPRLTGMAVEDAENVLLAQGLSLGYVETVPSEKLRGVVLEQSPEAGTNAEPGAVVALTVSGGRVVVPELVGQREEEAVERMNAIGLTCGDIGYQNVETARQDGVVLAQSIDKFTEVLPGSVVNMTVGRYDRRRYTANVTVSVDVPEEGVTVRVTLVDENGQENDMYAATYSEAGSMELRVTLRSETSGVRTWRLYLDGNFKSEATAVLQ